MSGHGCHDTPSKDVVESIENDTAPVAFTQRDGVSGSEIDPARTKHCTTCDCRHSEIEMLTCSFTAMAQRLVPKCVAHSLQDALVKHVKDDPRTNISWEEFLVLRQCVFVQLDEYNAKLQSKHGYQLSVERMEQIRADLTNNFKHPKVAAPPCQSPQDPQPVFPAQVDRTPEKKDESVINRTSPAAASKPVSSSKRKRIKKAKHAATISEPKIDTQESATRMYLCGTLTETECDDAYEACTRLIEANRGLTDPSPRVVVAKQVLSILKWGWYDR